MQFKTEEARKEELLHRSSSHNADMYSDLKDENVLELNTSPLKKNKKKTPDKVYIGNKIVTESNNVSSCA